MGRIFITGDCHGDIDIAKIKRLRSHNRKMSFTKEDVLIITGDFGGVWYGNEKDNFWLDWWDSCPWTTVFIDGNHENHAALQKYPIITKFGAPAHEIRPSVFHLMRGFIYTLNKYQFFTFGGALSVDRAYRAENVSWWKDELPTKEEFLRGIDTCERAYNEVDYVITHACPTYIRQGLWKPFFKDFSKEEILQAYGSDHLNIEQVLDTFYNQINYKKWYFGHYHTDKEVKGARCLYNSVYEITSEGDKFII